MKTIIIPTYNEAVNITSLLERLFSLKENGLRVIVVDDNSSDGTADQVLALTEKYPLTLIKRTGKLGLGSAYILGFKQALQEGAEMVFEMDADWSHDPLEIPKFIKAIEAGAEAVIGSRYILGGDIANWNFSRRLMSRMAIWLARVVLNLKTVDLTSGYRCYAKSALEQVDLGKIKSNGYAFQTEMLFYLERAGVKVKELPIKFIDRSFGHSKLSAGEITKFFFTLIRLKIKP